MLPKNEATFHVSITGELTGKLYEGDFTVKAVLNNAESMQAAIAAERYCGGSLTLAPSFRMEARATSEMELRVLPAAKGNRLQAPQWYEDSNACRELLDRNVIIELFGAAADAQRQYVDALKAESAKSEAHKRKPKAEDDPAEDKQVATGQG